MEDKIIDDLIKEKFKDLSPVDKVFRVIEGVLRLLFFIFVNFTLVSIIKERITIHKMESSFPFGIAVIILVFEIFYINHLIQGIRCILIKEYKSHIFFPIISLLGLFFFLLIVIIAVFENTLPNPEIYNIIPWIIISTILIYLIVKEFNLIKRRVR